MIVHNIAFRFDAPDGPGRRRLATEFGARLAALEDRIDEVNSMTIAVDLGVIDDHFDLVLVSTHDSYDDLEKYQLHPLHQELAAYGRTIIVGRACVDYEVPDTSL